METKDIPCWIYSHQRVNEPGLKKNVPVFKIAISEMLSMYIGEM